MNRLLLGTLTLLACGGGGEDPDASDNGAPSLTLLLTGEAGGLLEPCG